MHYFLSNVIFFFSTLYILWKNLIRAYSTQTGDFVREFEAADYRIAGMIMHPDNSNIIIGCTENGELNYWSCQSGIITKKLVGIYERIVYEHIVLIIFKRNIYIYTDADIFAAIEFYRHESKN